MISLYDLQYQSFDIMHVVVFTYLHVIDLFVTIQTNNFILSIHLNRFTLSTQLFVLEYFLILFFL